MTSQREALLKTLQHKRSLISWTSAVGLYLLAMLIFAISSFYNIEDYGDYSGPVVVRIGKPEGNSEAKTENKINEATVPETQTVQKTQEEQIPIISNALSSTKTDTKTIAQAQTTQQEQSHSGPVTESIQKPGETNIRGSESGNSYDLTLLSSPGTVGRGFYEPVWIFMPVPTKLPISIYEAIPDLPGLIGTATERKALFKKHYKESGDEWLLSGFKQPDYDTRSKLWVMLEEAGYDIKNAEYKTQNKLRPIVILFRVSAPGTSGIPELLDIHVESSSGLSNIDNDVLYAFKRAQFYNSGDKAISGRYTYRF